MKVALTSINKPHVDNILDLKKDIEWRTKPLPLGQHLAYETKRHGGKGIVVGSFYVVRNYVFNDVDEIPAHFIRRGKVSRNFIGRYAKGRKIYANVITDAERFCNPMHISELTSFRTGKPLSVPPQSFLYVDLQHYIKFAQVED